MPVLKGKVKAHDIAILLNLHKYEQWEGEEFIFDSLVRQADSFDHLSLS